MIGSSHNFLPKVAPLIERKAIEDIGVKHERQLVNHGC